MIFARKPKPRSIVWGTRRLDLEDARQHNFLIMGAIGSGKTTILRLIMHDIIPHITPESDQRAVIYDPKTEFVPLLNALKHDETDMYIMHPRDERAYAWNIAADVHNEEDAEGIANTLVPARHRSGGNEGFFTSMTRAIAKHTILGLRATRMNNWDFLDLVSTILAEDSRNSVLGSTADGQSMLSDLGAPETRANVYAEIRSRFEPLRRIGQFMRHHKMKGRLLSLKDWAKSSSLLVLGHDSEPSSALDEFNRTVVQRLQAILLQPTNQRDTRFRTALIFDEFAGFTDVKSMRYLLEQGRSYGLCTILAFQTLSSLESAFGSRADFETLRSQIGNLMVLRLNNQVDAEWASREFGHKELRDGSTSEDHYGRFSMSQPFGDRTNEQPVVRATRFLSIPSVNTAKSVIGYCKTPLYSDIEHFEIPLTQLMRFDVGDPDTNKPIEPFPQDWQPYWRQDEKRRPPLTDDRAVGGKDELSRIRNYLEARSNGS